MVHGSVWQGRVDADGDANVGKQITRGRMPGKAGLDALSPKDMSMALPGF